MQEIFNTYNQALIKESNKVLLAVSGGKDSIAMLHFFLKSKHKFGIAHCNFQLRGKESDEDELFVKNIAQERNIPFHSIQFNTTNYAKEKGISIQMAARELRYNWFDKISIDSDYQLIATAHHKNDVAETMILNLVKGTGIAGLHGIKNKDKLIRPLLCFSSHQLADFLSNNKITYREDSSNSDTKYTRNLIRHTVIPALEQINPSIINTLNEEAERFTEAEQILEEKIEEVKQFCFETTENGIKIKIPELLKLNPIHAYLYYMIKDYGFNGTQVTDIINSLNGQSGKTFYVSNYSLIKDRTFLFIEKLKHTEFIEKTILSVNELPFEATIKEVDTDFKITAGNNLAYLDYDKLNFPLKLRKWSYGDSFQPLGMTGVKKISDFLIDEKVPLPEKDKQLVLEDNGEVIWLVGRRINDNYKITNLSKRVLVLSI